MEADFEVIRIPAEMSDADTAAEVALIQELRLLQGEFQERQRRILDRIAKIRGRYPDKIILTPKTPAYSAKKQS